MSRSKWVALAVAMGLTSSMVLVPAFAEDKPADEKQATEKKEEPKKEAKGPRLVKPWSLLGSLTLEQKLKIDEIHKAAVAEKRKIEEKEEADITALLTDEQKAELQAHKETEAAARKAKEAERKKDEPKKEEKSEPKKEEKPEAKDGM